MNKRIRIALALGLALATPVTALAQGGQPPLPPEGQQPGQRHEQQQHREEPRRSTQPQKGGDAGHGQATGGNRQHSRAVVDMNERHRDQVRQWNDQHRGWATPAPENVRRGVVINGRLQPGHYHRPPPAMVDLLPRPPAGYAYFAVGTDVVLAVIATGIIAQIVFSGY